MCYIFIYNIFYIIILHHENVALNAVKGNPNFLKFSRGTIPHTTLEVAPSLALPPRTPPRSPPTKNSAYAPVSKVSGICDTLFVGTNHIRDVMPLISLYFFYVNTCIKSKELHKNSALMSVAHDGIFSLDLVE